MYLLIHFHCNLGYVFLSFDELLDFIIIIIIIIIIITNIIIIIIIIIIIST